MLSKSIHSSSQYFMFAHTEASVIFDIIITLLYIIDCIYKNQYIQIFINYLLGCPLPVEMAMTKASTKNYYIHSIVYFI